MPWTGFCFSRNLPEIFLSIWFAFAASCGFGDIRWLYHFFREKTENKRPPNTSARALLVEPSCSGYQLMQRPWVSKYLLQHLWNNPCTLCLYHTVLPSEAVVVWTCHWHSRRKRVYIWWSNLARGGGFSRVSFFLYPILSAEGTTSSNIVIYEFHRQ